MEKVMRCARCALPEAFPGVKFDNNQICNYCYYYDIQKEREMEVKKIIEKEVIDLINASKNQKNNYDCIVAYSGGKDSTFLLYYLKEKFNLKILAHTLDNGFISKTTLKNIKIITKNLSIDHQFTKPNFEMMRSIFNTALSHQIPYPKEILSMMSSCCSTCIGIVLGTSINLALKLDIPLLVIGLTPGQYPAISLENFFKVKSFMFFSEGVYKDDPVDILKIIRDPINEEFGDRAEQLLIKSQYLNNKINMPKVIFPFHALCDYNEKEILETIKTIGWERPEDTDSCSTNCRLNSVAIYAHVKKYNYHPYVGEMSVLVREGKMTYEELLEAEKLDKNLDTIKQVMKQLKIKKEDI